MLNEHPLRRSVVGEMHLRRWPPLATPSLVIQVLRLVREEERAAERAHLAALPSGGQADASDNNRHLSGQLPGGIAFAWERHTEASSLTLFAAAPGRDAMLDPQADPALRAALDWADALPGSALRATRIVLMPDEAAAQALLPHFALAEAELVSCHLGSGARLWSDFRIGPGGFGTLLIAANGLPGGDLARLAQRVQELGNYRNMALLGLPVAQEHWGRLNGMEAELRVLAGDVARPDLTDDSLLDRVSALSLELMTLSAATSYRMNATAAYARLVEERLEQAEPRAIAGYQSLTDFTQRRLMPAVRTCAAFSRRDAELSDRAARFAALLRTRVETRIENQNARLLRSMEQSARLQFRLQQLVEGLSVVALSYYAVSLLGYVLKGVKEWNHALPVPVILALATPLVMIGVAVTTHKLKDRLIGHDAE